jgi:DHA2 family multidrug resistance protein-like MFS transporter
MRSETGGASYSSLNGACMYISQEVQTTRILPVIALSLSIVIAMLDSTIANVALPVIAREFNVTASASILIVNAYQFAVVASLLPLAALGKSLGNKRIFEAGVVFFATSSLGCALSETLNMLTVFRVVQGFGAAAILSVNAALIKEIYPTRFLGRGLGINVMIVSVSAAAGPSIASAILSITSWHWLFIINVPIAIASLMLSVFFLEKRKPSGAQFDRTGAALVFTLALMFSFFVMGLTKEIAVMAIVSFAASVLILEVLYLDQRRKADKALIPIALFNNKTLTLSLMMSTLSYSTQLLAYVSLPFYFHNVLHRDVVETGLLLTAWPLATTVTSLAAGELVKRYDCNVIASVGLGLLLAGMVLMGILPAIPDNTDIIWRVALCGAGFGLFQSPNNYLIMTSVSDENTSVASGLLGSSRLLGQIIGSAMVAIYFNIIEAQAIEFSLLSGAGFCLLSLIVSFLRYIQYLKNRVIIPDDKTQ